MTDSIRDFIGEADAASLAGAWTAAGFAPLRRAAGELVGPCPACGGEDRFSIAEGKRAWNCRGAGGGHSPVGMIAHCLGYDASRREDLLRAAEIVLGRDRPGAPSTEAERLAREQAAAARRRKAEAAASARASEAHAFRERERAKARGIWQRARPIDGADPASAYLAARLGIVPLAAAWHLRFDPEITYWHGADEFGRPLALHAGPAMIAAILCDPMRAADGDNVVGCHITWIDLDRPPKCRPLLHARSGAGGGEGDALATKKMRGTKKGGIIPVLGDSAHDLWIGGEGIENGIAAWLLAGKPDAFVFAAGDLGNLAGPAAAHGRVKHPETGKWIPSPWPREDHGPREGRGPGDAMPVADGVREIVLLGDADSDPAATAAQMLRAQRRIERPGRVVQLSWPALGMDWAQMAGRSE